MTTDRRARRDSRQQPSQPKIQIPENVSEFYAKSLNIGTTAWDFMLFFGSIALPDTITGDRQPIRGQIRVDAVIRMSPQHAKASAKALQDVVKQYEERFGEIRIPDSAVEGNGADIQTSR